MAASALIRGDDGVTRCWWADADPLMREYHDREWGQPEHDERALFELLTLEAFQSGLSWLTILRKRDGFRRAFVDFDAEKVARFGERDVERLLGDASIVRHRGKIEATIANARASLEHPLAELAWEYAPPPRARPRPRNVEDLPAATEESTALSKELRRRGYRFVGPTTVYAFMQSAGLVDDHVAGCDTAPPGV